MHLPSHIQNIGVFAPAGYPSDAAALPRAIQTLSAANIHLVFPTQPSSPRRFFAAPDDIRLAQFHELLANPDIDALMALKGGYGTARLLPSIDWQLLRSRNLPIIGYSDLTALHLAALKHGCRNHIYGPMLTSTFGNTTASPSQQQSLALTIRSFENLLNGEDDLVTFGREHLVCLKPGHADAPLLPVCLSVLTSLIGTPHLPELRGCILAVEDINEPAHKIDRMLNQLRQCGILAKLAGLVFGTFHETEDDEYLDGILAEYAQCINGPVISGLQFGHIPAALSLPVGMNAILSAGSTISLTRSPLAAFSSQIFTASEDYSLNYRWLEPAEQRKGEKYPLVLFLHGAGERGEDNNAQLIHVLPHFATPDNRKAFPCFVCAPQCPVNQQWVDTPWSALSHTFPTHPSDALAAVMELLDELLLDYPIDTNRIYVMGISMGGYGTWDILARQPERFAAAVPICGGADEAQAPRLAHIPIWTFHGDSDSAVPVCRSRNMVEALRKAGGDIRYTEVPSCGHNAWTPAMATPQLLPWLFSQSK